MLVHDHIGSTGGRVVLVAMMLCLAWIGVFAAAADQDSNKAAGQNTAASGTVAALPRMKLISRWVPSYASSGWPALANDANYRTFWRSSGVPATLTYDLSSVPAANRQMLYLVWYNDANYSYDRALSGGPGFNNLGSYTLEVNPAPGGAGPPSAGWVTVERVSQNTLHSRDHVVKFAGFNWIRLNASVSDGSPSNSDVALNVDVYDASAGVTDGWFFLGDSITANCMGHAGPSDSFINEVGAVSGVYPAQQNAGLPSWSSADAISHLPDWLKLFHGLYVAIGLGTNDAAGGGNPAIYYANMKTLVQAVLAAGKVPVLPTIPWSADAAHAKSIPGLNSQLQSLYRAYPQIVPGPDLYDFFMRHPEEISADGVHPTEQGCAAMRALWADSAARSLYSRR